jgi:hypothetical protein
MTPFTGLAYRGKLLNLLYYYNNVSLQVDAGKYYFVQIMQDNKKSRYYIGKIGPDGEFEPFWKNVPLVADYFMRKAYKSLRIARLLESGRLPSAYVFGKQDFEEWKRSQDASEVARDNKIAKVIRMLREMEAVEVTNEG